MFRFLLSLPLLFFLFTLSELALGDTFSLSDGGQETVTALTAQRLNFDDPDTPTESSLPGVDNAAKTGGAHKVGKTKWLLQVRGPITDLLKADINAYFASSFNPQFASTQLGQYIPYNTFLISGYKSKEFRQFLKSAPAVRNARLYQKNWKINQQILSLENDATYLKGSNSITVRAQLFSKHNDDHSTTDANEIIAEYKTYASTIPVLREPSVEAQVANYYTLIFIVHKPAALSLLVTWLSLRDEVNLIEEKFQPKLLNFYAKQTVQSDVANQFPLANNNLLGDGMTIGVADSVLDFNNSYFTESNGAPPALTGTYQSNRRKIVFYKNFGGTAPSQLPAGAFNHGTHVSGTVAGSILDSSDTCRANLAKFNGMAPNAKLAFIQLQGAGGISVPEPISKIFTWEQEASATISSNSFGGKAVSYTTDAFNIDNYTKSHPNFLPLFAAGNSGEQGFQTVTGESSAKNVLSVGASYSTRSSYADDADSAPDFRSYPLTFKPSGKQTLPFVGAAANYAWPPGDYDTVKAVPFNACGPITNADAIPYPTVALIDASGPCTMQQKYQNLLAASILFVIIKANGPAQSYKDTGNVDLAIFVVSDNFWKAAGFDSATPTGITAEELDYTEKEMAVFSSRGPTYDGRIKPDIVAPGVSIRSAKGTGAHTPGTCAYPGDILRESGTSMATPVTAGTALLVQEYFRKGYYPTGTANAPAAFTPLAALVKAVIIASGVSLSGAKVRDPVSTTGYEVVKAVPDPIQGFGRIQMNTVLVFDEDHTSAPKKTLWVNKDTLAINTGGRHSYCFQAFPRSGNTSATSGKPLPSLRATLVWTDEPGVVNAAVVLINNLDLAIVRVSNHKVYTGNQWPSETWDSVNNVEQITVPAADIQPAGEYFAVIVNGVNVPATAIPQNYGLVVNGFITKVDESNCAGTAAFCPNNCGSPVNGTCVTAKGNPVYLQGQCNCSASQAGADCSQANPVLGPVAGSGGLAFRTSGTVNFGQYKYFRIPLTSVQFNSLTTGMAVSLAVQDSSIAADVFVRAVLPLPSRYDHGFAVYGSKGTGNPTKRTWAKDSIPNFFSTDGGTVYFAVSGYCCGSSSYQVNVTFS